MAEKRKSVLVTGAAKRTVTPGRGRPTVPMRLSWGGLQVVGPHVSVWP